MQKYDICLEENEWAKYSRIIGSRIPHIGYGSPIYTFIYLYTYMYPIHAERCVQHLLSERLRLSA